VTAARKPTGDEALMAYVGHRITDQVETGSGGLPS
jgi:hypothetical protein